MQLGREFVKIIKNKMCALGAVEKFYEEAEILEYSSSKLDVSNKENVFELLRAKKPYAVLNCAAKTNVDACETEKEAAFKVNALGPKNLALAADEIGFKLIHISTDYVFDGSGKERKIESDIINPKTVYGKSKALGEEYVKNFCKRYFILRTSWLYGEFGNNFVKTIVTAARNNESLNVVDDQFGSPTNAEDLSFLISKILITDEYGTYHCSGNGECSWFEFAVEIVKNFKINCKINMCSTQDFKRAAPRPKYSVLENFMLKLTIGDCFRDWKLALADFAKKIKKVL